MRLGGSRHSRWPHHPDPFAPCAAQGPHPQAEVSRIFGILRHPALEIGSVNHLRHIGPSKKAEGGVLWRSRTTMSKPTIGFAG